MSLWSDPVNFIAGWLTGLLTGWGLSSGLTTVILYVIAWSVTEVRLNRLVERFDDARKVGVKLINFNFVAIYLNCEDQLLDIVRVLDVRDFLMASSANDSQAELDVALVEGAVVQLKNTKSLQVRSFITQREGVRTEFRTATRITAESGTLSRSARMMPPMAVTGAAMVMLSIISTIICTCCTSLVLRVISEGVPNTLTSVWAKLPTRAKSAARTSRPNDIAVREPQ